MVFRLRNAYNQAELEMAVSDLIRTFNNTVQPNPTTHFPRDLDIATNVLESLLDLVSEESLLSIHTVCTVMCWHDHHYTDCFHSCRTWLLFWIDCFML